MSDRHMALYLGHQTVPYLKLLVTRSYSRDMGFIPAQSMFDLWSTMWHWDRLFSDYYGLPIKYNSTNTLVLSIDTTGPASARAVSPHPKSNTGHQTGLWVWSSCLAEQMIWLPCIHCQQILNQRLTVFLVVYLVTTQHTRIMSHLFKRLEVLTALLQKTQAFWDVTLYRQDCWSQHFEGSMYLLHPQWCFATSAFHSIDPMTITTYH